MVGDSQTMVIGLSMTGADQFGGGFMFQGRADEFYSQVHSAKDKENPQKKNEHRNDPVYGSTGRSADEFSENRYREHHR